VGLWRGEYKRTKGRREHDRSARITTEGTDAILEEAAVQNFADGLRGPLLRPGNGIMTKARKVWNA